MATIEDIDHDQLTQQIRAAWQQGTLFDDFAFELPKLTASVGTAGTNRRADNAKVQSLLARVGQLDLAKTEGPTGYGLMTLENGIERFQRDQGLKVDGRVAPGGPTIQRLAEVTRLGQRRMPVTARATTAPAAARRIIQGAGTRPVSGQQVIEPPASPPPPKMSKIRRSPLPDAGDQTVPSQAAPRRDWKGVIPKRPPLNGNVFFPGAGMDPEGEYTPDFLKAFREYGMANVRVADKEKWYRGSMPADILDALLERYRDDEPSDFSSFKRGSGQLNLIGYSHGALLAAQAAADLADQGRKVDHLVLIGAPISKEFLDQLKSNPNIGKVIVVDLTKHGDQLYAGMPASELHLKGQGIGGGPRRGPFAQRGIEARLRSKRSESNLPMPEKYVETGHHYYSDAGPEEMKRRRELVKWLHDIGLR